ncbi:DUF4190 domain-containing protein [Actinomadura algeriensis]|uniref:Septum formation-related domain-containing protein n=1 Tax=Actinomadura algeriensis TaxID=1679523 RepID=A0ABR9JWQ7_9ACTN|nr:DUF4190 domain-containing protein [Actinomadura algeriensis]MBE1535012.1 hypothetical protein [Actinomadura algeriensis]
MTTPPDAHGADDASARRPSGAVPFSDLPGTGAPPPASTGAVPFSDPPGTGALPFSDLPEMDAAPPYGPPGTSAAPFPQAGFLPTPPGVPAAAGPQPQPPPDEPPRTSGLAVTALLTGLFGLIPLALGFGIAALVHRRRSTRKGKGFALVGIAASAAWSVAIGMLTPVVLESVFSVERDESGAISKGGKALFSTLRKGDCFTDYDVAKRLRMVEAVPCTEPHTGEIVTRSALPDGPYPGDDRTEAATHVVCGAEFAGLRKSPHYPKLRPYYEWPEAAWNTGNRQVTCALHHEGGALESRLADTVKAGLHTYDELRRGHCIETWVRETHPHISAISCRKSHFAEVFATYEISPKVEDDPLEYPPYPGKDALTPQVLGKCEARLTAIFARPPRPDLELFAIPPSPNDWESGIRTAVCMLTANGRDLKGSLVPR